MAPSFNSPKQELEQGICGQHGWSSSYFQAPSSRWCVEVRWGVGPRNGRVFVSDDVSDGASKAGVKKGHAAAATVAIAGLRDIVYAANSKQTLTIEEAFGAQFDHTCFVMSGPEGWAKLWEINPTEVFVDVEGNQVTPPVLVQVCVTFQVCVSGEQQDRSMCLLEMPNPEIPARLGGLSDDMRRLLGDPKITKVFCDGTSGLDRRSLDRRLIGDNYVDLEDIASSLVGETGVRRGLARIMNLAWPNPAVRVTKDTRDKESVLFFAAIEQRKKPRLKELDEIPNRVRRYAAMDAWCTMMAYHGLRQQARQQAQREGLPMTD